MAFDYQPEKVGKSALHFVRLATGDTKELRSHLPNEAIEALLTARGLKPTDSPTDNWNAVHETIADGHEMIAARLANESEVAITEVGVVKSTAASTHLRLAKIARSKVRVGAGSPIFQNPKAYGVSHVPSVDALPELEA